MSPQQSTARPQSTEKGSPSPNGQTRGASANLPLPPEELQRLHYYLKLTREFDQRMVDMFRAGQLLGTFFSQVGQEACDVVPTFFANHDDDIVCPSHRDLGAAIGRDAPVYLMAANMLSRATAQDKGLSHPVFWGYTDRNFLVPSSVIGNQYCVGVGAAMAFKMRKQPNVALVFLGEGGSSNGALYEGMNFAGLHRLPVIFVIQNNWWAESVPIHLQAAVEDLSLRAVGFNMPGIRLNGNDVPNMIAPIREAVDRARNGDGPTLFQMDTYRWYGHSSIDPANYRDTAEEEFYKAQDPVANFEKWLLQNGVYTQEALDSRNKAIGQEITDGIVRASGDPEPDSRQYLDLVYCPEGPLPAPVQRRWEEWDGKSRR